MPLVPDPPKGLTYWLNWLETFKEWACATPEGIYSNPSYTVLDVAYDDLHALAGHFNEQVAPEDVTHRQWLSLLVWHGMSAATILFKSPPRAFTYAPLP